MKMETGEGKKRISGEKMKVGEIWKRKPNSANANFSVKITKMDWRKNIHSMQYGRSDDYLIYYTDVDEGDLTTLHRKDFIKYFEKEY